MQKWARLEDFMNKYGFEEVADHTKVRVHLQGKSVVVERCMVGKMQRDLEETAPGLCLITTRVDQDAFGNKMVLEDQSEQLKANDWIWCDERLPTAEEAKFQLNILVAELDHNEDPADPNAHWCIDVDFATYCGNGEGYARSDWCPDNDWDEGQPWAVVAWRLIPKLPDVDQVKNRDLKWLNIKKDHLHN